MKICIDLTPLADNFTGIERFAGSIALELIKNKEDSFILVFKREIHFLFSNVCHQQNVSFMVLKECNKLLFNQFRLPFNMAKIKADWFIFLAFPVPVLLFKKNMVETIHDLTAWDCPRTMTFLSKWYFRLSHKIALKKCRAIITISDFSKQRICKRLKYPEDKIWLIYCGVDLKRFTFEKEKCDYIREKYKLPQRYILSLSTIEPRKNLPLLIEAYNKIVSSKSAFPPLVLAGRKGWKTEEIIDSVNLSAKDAIFFTGFIDEIDLPCVYSLADFFVFPSKYEGFGIPPLEAMACGVPVVSSNSSSLPEVLGNSALFFENGDVGSLEQAMMKMCQMSYESRLTLIESGYRQVSKFNWAAASRDLYNKLLLE